MEDVSIFYGRLIFLWLFGIFCGNLVCLHIFPFVGILYKIKSGNPVLHHGEQLGFMSKCLKKLKTCFCRIYTRIYTGQVLVAPHQKIFKQSIYLISEISTVAATTNRRIKIPSTKGSVL
jgi:hypothetical protein